jgi:hypothetical protein
MEFIQTHSVGFNPNLRNRKAVSPERKKQEESTEESSQKTYSKEQLDGIARIKKHKAKGDLYAILGLQKDCSPSDIKKAYRKVIRILTERVAGVIIPSRQMHCPRSR